ncbi:MAG: hypothetical protein SF162_02505 [bacterium]|nr:hypothetical protein [bacterium]
MFKRIRLQPVIFTAFEAGVIGLFFIQALRLLIGLIYSRVAGATALSALDPAIIPPGTPIPADPQTLTGEITLLGYLLALPLVALLIGQFRIVIIAAVILTALGRAFLIPAEGFPSLPAAGLVVMGGLLYIALIARHRLRSLPYFFVLGFAADQLLRAVGNTLDPSWSVGYREIQFAFSGAVIVLSLLLVVWETRRATRPRDTNEGEALAPPENGLIPLWGAVGLGGLLFLELALLALPNAVAARGDLDYTTVTPFLVAATLLPIIPAVRGQARAFMELFEGSTRGWLWLLVTILVILLGLRVSGLGAALIIAQFLLSMAWWWIGRPKAARERSFAGLWLIFSLLVFIGFVTADNFTYEYAFVRDLGGNLRFLNDVIPPLLRGFRDLGFAVILLAVFLALLPMIQMRRRIAWYGGSTFGTVITILIVAAASAGAAYAARPPIILDVRNAEQVRVGTYNIHGGFSEFYAYDLEAVAAAIQQSGSNIVMVQEIERGRLTSFGVDQPLWLGRRLGMDGRFFATNEGIQGLAVLSNIRIAFDDGVLLPSLGAQTGVQRVQITPSADSVITVYNTWLSPLLEIDEQDQTLGIQEQDQARQLNALFGVVAAHHPNGILGRTVIGGTFHNVPDSDLLQQMRVAGFIDPFAGYPLELGATFVRFGLPRARFDYLWLRNLPLGEGVNVSQSTASDHRLAYAAVQINR